MNLMRKSLVGMIGLLVIVASVFVFLRNHERLGNGRKVDARRPGPNTSGESEQQPKATGDDSLPRLTHAEIWSNLHNTFDFFYELEPGYVTSDPEVVKLGREFIRVRDQQYQTLRGLLLRIAGSPGQGTERVRLTPDELGLFLFPEYQFEEAIGWKYPPEFAKAARFMLLRHKPGPPPRSESQRSLLDYQTMSVDELRVCLKHWLFLHANPLATSSRFLLRVLSDTMSCDSPLFVDFALSILRNLEWRQSNVVAAIDALGKPNTSTFVLGWIAENSKSVVLPDLEKDTTLTPFDPASRGIEGPTYVKEAGVLRIYVRHFTWIGKAIPGSVELSELVDTNYLLQKAVQMIASGKSEDEIAAAGGFIGALRAHLPDEAQVALNRSLAELLSNDSAQRRYWAVRAMIGTTGSPALDRETALLIKERLIKEPDEDIREQLSGVLTEHLSKHDGTVLAGIDTELMELVRTHPQRKSNAGIVGFILLYAKTTGAVNPSGDKYHDFFIQILENDFPVLTREEARLALKILGYQTSQSRKHISGQ